MRQWLRTAEPLGERRYENWNTHMRFIRRCLYVPLVPRNVRNVNSIIYNFKHVTDASSVDPYRTLSFVVSDPGLHYLSTFLLWNTKHK